MPFPIMTPLPSTSDPTNFAPYMDAFIAKFPAWGAEADAKAAAMTAVAAGGAVSLQYIFSTTVTDADPGAGLLRLSAATQNTSTVIRADVLGSDTSDYTGMLNLLDDSTSTNKGYLTLRHATAPGKWLVFSVASIASPAGYRNVAVTCVASSAASPFANGDPLLFDFTPTGDKGETGATGAAGAGIAPQAVGFTLAGGTSSKTLTVDEDMTVSQMGFRTIPQNSQSVAYTAVLADSGKHLLHPSADMTARTFTIPANAAVAYPLGTAITFVNQASAGVMTISITTDTMRFAGAGTTGSRTLAANGVATAIKLTATEWIISGAGLT